MPTTVKQGSSLAMSIRSGNRGEASVHGTTLADRWLAIRDEAQIIATSLIPPARTHANVGHVGMADRLLLRHPRYLALLAELLADLSSLAVLGSMADGRGLGRR